jgi:hypothetical protein
MAHYTGIVATPCCPVSNGIADFLTERNARPGSLSRDALFRYVLTKGCSTDILSLIRLEPFLQSNETVATHVDPSCNVHLS